MSKHTPGPWVIYDDSNDGKTNRIEIAALGKTVARIYHSVPAEDIPNARLIAAAPEMLAALVDVVAVLQKHYPKQAASPGSIVERALAAIAKATGEQP